MSIFLNQILENLTPYEPGEQPKDGQYIKLNTNESPYFPSRYCLESAGSDDIQNLRLYSDPECTLLRKAVAARYKISEENVLPVNGSDEALAFCFAAFCSGGAAFPDVTYGFYKVFAGLFGVNYTQIPLDENFEVNASNYFNIKKTIFLANPNAQTGIYLPLEEIEKIVASNPADVVVVDEAYIDFGGKSAVRLTDKYRNLVVVQTFSKSRSLAGARVGFAIADKSLIEDLKRVKYSFNPYNVNSLSAKLAAAAIADEEYFLQCTQKIIRTREKLTLGLKNLGLTVLPSKANFVLAESKSIDGQTLYKKLKLRGVLVRHFNDERIKNYIRITVGTDEQTDILLKKTEEIINEKS